MLMKGSGEKSLKAISKGAPLKIKIDASSSYAGKLGPALILNQNPFFEMAYRLSPGLGTGAHQGQFFVYFKKYQKPGFVFIIDILPALQRLQQFRILLFCDLGQKKAFAFVTGSFFNEHVTGMGI